METLTLIGMPASGKSTVGRLAAELLCRPFFDGDDLIRTRFSAPLPVLIAQWGREGFLRLEEETLCAFSERGAVLATGGSAVYSARAMEHLRTLGRLVYLRLPEEEMERRIPDPAARGVVMQKGGTLKELFAERAPLYEKFADVTLDCAGRTPEELAKELLSL